MAKTILIPIDFSVESLNTLKYALTTQNEQVNVVLLYGHLLGDSISDLLFYTPKSAIASLTSPEFEQAIAIITNRYATTIQKLSIEILNAANASLLNNILKSNAVQSIYVPKCYKIKVNNKGFDPISLLKKSGIIIHEIEWASNIQSSERDQLDSLFN